MGAGKVLHFGFERHAVGAELLVPTATTISYGNTERYVRYEYNIGADKGAYHKRVDACIARHVRAIAARRYKIIRAAVTYAQCFLNRAIRGPLGATE